MSTQSRATGQTGLKRAAPRAPIKGLTWLLLIAGCLLCAALLMRWKLARDDARFERHLQTAKLSELEQIAKTRDWDPEVFYWLGSRLTQSGRHKEALTALSRAAALNPKSALTRAMLGLALARTDNPEAAEIQMRQAIELNSRLEFPHFALGSLYGRYKRWPQAADELKTAVKMAPNDTEAQYLLAITYGEMFQEDLKMDILERLVKQYPNNPQYLKSLGYVYLFYGRFEDAVAIYRRILSIAPDDPEGHYLLGRALAEMASTPEEFATADKELTVALSTEPNNPNGLLAMGILCFRRNQPAKAATELERALKNGVTEQKTWMYLGQSYERIGRDADAKRTLAVFQRSASINRTITQLENRLLNAQDDTPDRIKENADVRMRLVKVYMDDNRYQLALNHLNILSALHPDDKEVRRLTAICGTKLEQQKAAHVKSSQPM